MLTFFALFFTAALFELVDSAIGMMYGTLMTPVLVLSGYKTIEVVPAILFSQAAGGIIAAICHHRVRNGRFNGLTPHLRIVLMVVMSGVFAIIAGVTFASFISEKLLKLYIGILVLLMGIMCHVSPRMTFSLKKVIAIGFLASFNKSATGGGFGPLCSTGMIVSGLNSRTGIAITTLSEVPLCFLAFILYSRLAVSPNYYITGILTFGALAGAVVGPKLCSIIDLKLLKTLIGVLAMLSGVLLIYKAL